MKTLFNNLIIRILSFLLHHANRQTKDERYYKIKNRILAKYGKHVCYDVQFIEGKECWTCNGTGVFKSSWKLPETCWSCGGTKFYRLPTWNILSKVRMGKYEFYQPYKRVFSEPQSVNPVIIGYIDHSPSKIGPYALILLFLIYEKGYLKRWYDSNGYIWSRNKWWKPSRFICNVIHIIKFGRKSPPAKWLKECFKVKQKHILVCEQFDDGLPF